MIASTVLSNTSVERATHRSDPLAIMLRAESRAEESVNNYGGCMSNKERVQAVRIIRNRLVGHIA